MFSVSYLDECAPNLIAYAPSCNQGNGAMTTMNMTKLSRVDTAPDNHVDGSNVDFHPACEHVCPMMLYLYS